MLASVRPLGTYIDDVFAGRPTVLTRLVRPLETSIYRVCRIGAAREMTWRTYAFALVSLSSTTGAAVDLGVRLQASFPLDPQRFGNLTTWSACASG